MTLNHLIYLKYFWFNYQNLCHILKINPKHFTHLNLFIRTFILI